MSLATKYRPQTFDSITEQSTIVNIISKICNQDEIKNRNFLFIGPAGCGKTTLARLMANVLNDGQGSTIEIDAASHNGVDSVREIINQARQYPVIGKYKVFVIDECFSKYTKVNTIDGLKQICDVKIGDQVFTSHGIKEVTNTFVNTIPVNHLLKLKFDDGSSLVTTLGHRFCTFDGWVEAGKLSVNSKLKYLFSQETCKNYKNLVSIVRYSTDITNVEFQSHFSQSDLDSGFVDMYDLEVEEDHEYYVNGILVHNCHTFSPQAWQMFLKTLEDAPAKSIFVFATTNPEKIPATIISRVQTFQLSKISLQGIFNRLKYVIEQENKEGADITYTDDAVNFIAKLANGGMRDSLTNLEKVLTFTHDLTSESVAEALNLPNYDDYFKLLGAYSKKDNKVVSEVINNVYNSGVNFVKWFEGFHSFVMNVVKYIFLQDINLTMIPSHYQEKIAKYGTAHSVVCLNLANKLMKLNHDLKTTQYLQEVALTYLCQTPKKEG